MYIRLQNIQRQFCLFSLFSLGQICWTYCFSLPSCFITHFAFCAESPFNRSSQSCPDMQDKSWFTHCITHVHHYKWCFDKCRTHKHMDVTVYVFLYLASRLCPSICKQLTMDVALLPGEQRGPHDKLKTGSSADLIFVRDMKSQALKHTPNKTTASDSQLSENQIWKITSVMFVLWYNTQTSIIDKEKWCSFKFNIYFFSRNIIFTLRRMTWWNAIIFIWCSKLHCSIQYTTHTAAEQKMSIHYNHACMHTHPCTLLPMTTDCR